MHKDTLPVLYKLDKNGSVREWRAWVEGSTIYTMHGTVGGEMQTASKQPRAVNKGKRTPEQQAEFEVVAMHKKQTDGMYRETVEDAKVVPPLPMLASKFSKAVYPLDIQPKLDGVRCFAIAEEVDGKVQVKLISRTGKTYDIAHISDEHATTMKAGEIRDGEVYIHGMSRQNIISLVKNTKKLERIKLEHWVYDVPSSEPWKVRVRTLPFGGKYIMTVQAFMVMDEAEAWGRHNYLVEHGYEGAIARNMSGMYEYGYRSKDLMKLKRFIDDEFEVVGFTEGKGSMVGCVIWKCITKEDKEFSCSMKCTYAERKEYYEAGGTYVGEWLTVRYQHLSDTLVPQFPVGIAFRPAEDMPERK